MLRVKKQLQQVYCEEFSSILMKCCMKCCLKARDSVGKKKEIKRYDLFEKADNWPFQGDLRNQDTYEPPECHHGIYHPDCTLTLFSYLFVF